MGLAGHGDGSRFDRLANNYDAEFSVKKIGKYYQIVTKGSPKIGDSKNIVTKDGRRINLAKARLMRKSGNIVCEYDLKDEHDLAFAADFANHLQNMTSDVVLELFERNFTKDRPIVVSGGTFANVVTNGILNKKYNIFITPPMGDEGLALGAAAWGAYISDIRKLNIKNMYLGFDTGTNSNVDLTRIGEMLADGKVVGLIEGKMELGPRALGARTILADPRDINANLTINERLGRVEYMPFAPVILEEYASDILVDWSPKHLSSRHMTVIYAVHDKWKEKLKGVVHVDGTVRPQVICRKDNKVYYDIVEAFFKCTGIPVLINTSFNSHGEPIVRTIDDGLRALKSGRVDVLVAGNKITLTDDMEDTAVNL
jgi:carbamoyltransferase